MIAFVIVAAALAFVVLNMGFSTTQKAKTTIISGLGEASSSLEVAGKVTGIACTTVAGGCGSAGSLNVTAVPIKIASGGESINLDPSLVSISLITNSIQYDDIYGGIITDQTIASLGSALDEAVLDTIIDSDPLDAAVPSSTTAFIYWAVSSGTQNAILDQGEHAVLAVAFQEGDRPTELDTIRIEISLPTGSPLTVERQVPNLSYTITDLG